MLSNLRRPLIVCLFLIQLVRATPTPSDKQALNSHPEFARYAKSAEMRNYMDETIDPCEDFYNFTCGNYYKINPPITMPFRESIFENLLKSINRKFAALLRNDDGTNNVIEKMPKDFYKSCMNMPNLKNVYKSKVQEIISEFGQMPALVGDKWQESEFDWLRTVAEIAHKYDIRIIVGHRIQADFSNNTVNRVHFLYQDNPLESASIYRDDIHKRFLDSKKINRAEILENFLGLDAKLAEQTVNEIFEFEANFFAGYQIEVDEDEDVNEEEQVDDSTPINTLTTIEAMHSKYSPKLDIKRLINISLGFIPTEPVRDWIYEVDNLALLMKRTPKRVVANYIYYHLLEQFILRDPRDETKLHNMCIERANTHFYSIIENKIYGQYRTEQTEQDVQYMWKNIKSAFRKVLQSDKLAWMRNDTRQYALEKLQTIRLEITSHDHINFTQEYGPLRINSHDYIGNLKSIFALNALKSRAKLQQAPQPYDNAKGFAGYILYQNRIIVSVSILQPYYVWSDIYPNALKFSTLGFLIAHELIHGFEDHGRKFDKFGNKREWWDQASSDYFNNQTKCFSEQYRQYIYDGRNLPEMTQSENIADNGGIRLAYDAYLQWYEDVMFSYQRMDLESMPRLKYTSKQLFFISYGQLWCTATHPDIRKFTVSTDVHLPGQFRVIGPLSNMEEFAKEFNCPKGSGMNPVKKCVIY